MPTGSKIRRSDSCRLAGDLAAILVAARGDRTRVELAASAGVHPNTLGDLETGRANPTLAYLEALGPVYGIRIDLAVDVPKAS